MILTRRLVVSPSLGEVRVEKDKVKVKEVRGRKADAPTTTMVMPVRVKAVRHCIRTIEAAVAAKAAKRCVGCAVILVIELTSVPSDMRIQQDRRYLSQFRTTIVSRTPISPNRARGARMGSTTNSHELRIVS